MKASINIHSSGFKRYFANTSWLMGHRVASMLSRSLSAFMLPCITGIPFAVPKEKARSSLPKKLLNMEIPTYTHTVNSLEEKNEFLDNFHINEMYTDC